MEVEETILEVKEVFDFTVAVDQLDTHAHFRLHVDGAYVGSLVLRSKEFLEFLYRLGRYDSDILGTTSEEIKERIISLFREDHEYDWLPTGV